jgi:hypothetical protein
MKKFFCFLLCALISVSLCSCGESVNMSVLTEYQNRDFEAELRIGLSGKEQACNLVKSGGRLFLRFREMSAFTFALDENGAAIISEGAEIPLGGGEALLLCGVYRLFSAPVAGTWKIEKVRLGGVPLYVCESEGLTLYIDAASHLPLKLLSGSITADVISFKVK